MSEISVNTEGVRVGSNDAGLRGGGVVKLRKFDPVMNGCDLAWVGVKRLDGSTCKTPRRKSRKISLRSISGRVTITGQIISITSIHAVSHLHLFPENRYREGGYVDDT